MRLLRHCLLPAALCGLLLSACGPPSPEKRAGADWIPDRTYRAKEIKQLPPSSQVEADQKRWSAANTNKYAMIYMSRFSGPAHQSEFKVEYSRRSSPLGNPWWTEATYKYTDPTNGSYIIRYRQLGRHNTDFLKLDNTPRLHWLLVDQIEMRGGVPVLEVIGIEGVTKFSAY
jgi:hypothetical protein